jgi:hypothetical protein
MERRTRKRFELAAGLGAALWLVVWLVVAVIVPLAESAACAGIEFRAGAPVTDPDPAARPPIGGDGGLAGKLRSALRDDRATVYCHDFADPFVLRIDGTYLAFSTQNEDHHVPLLTSGGLFGTARTEEALPELPRWSAPGQVWAPAALPRPGGFVLYYSTHARDSNRQCLSRAFSAEPSGPFVDDSSGPLVCPAAGAIDPSPFVDADGRAYLLWKTGGGGDKAPVVVSELAPDGLTLLGQTRALLTSDQNWEGGVIEGPSMVASGGRYYLFYSANDWTRSSYAIGYAVCDSPMGPCTKPVDGPWLASTEEAHGPGGQEVFVDERGQLWMALHAWLRGKVGYPDGARNLFVVRLSFVNGTPVVA